MKKAVLVVAVALMVVAILATPVMAIGPKNAVNNPHIEYTPAGFDILLPIHGVAHGMVHEWVTVAPYPVNTLDKDPRAFDMKSAYIVESPYQIDQMENQWLFVSQSILHDYYILHGVPTALIDYVLAAHPDGIYMKWNAVGQTG